MVQVDRSAINRSLARSLAYLESNKLEEAREHARALVRELTRLGLIQEGSS